MVLVTMGRWWHLPCQLVRSAVLSTTDGIGGPPALPPQQHPTLSRTLHGSQLLLLFAPIALMFAFLSSHSLLVVIVICFDARCYEATSLPGRDLTSTPEVKRVNRKLKVPELLTGSNAGF
jgi:hypothetical protein